MYFKISLFKSCGLVFVFVLISISSGFSLTFPLQEKALPDICILMSVELLEDSGSLNNEKDAKENTKSEFKNKRQLNRNSQEKIKLGFSTSTEQDDDKESPVKSYNQLKGLLEEVDMMVDGWM
jgi:hypothetical protein